MLQKVHFDLREKITAEGRKYYDNGNQSEFAVENKDIFHTMRLDEKGRPFNIYTESQQGVKKLVHPVYGYEVVLDATGQHVEDDVNMATYNFVLDSFGVNRHKHFRNDIEDMKLTIKRQVKGNNENN